MTVVIIFGPASVGKMTVGQKLCEITGYKLLHNHMTIDSLTPIFEFGSDPYCTLVSEFRFRILEEASKSDLKGLVHTFIWGFYDSDDTDFMRRVKTTVEANGARICFVELKASLETRKARAVTENRKKHKPGNVERGTKHLEEYERGRKHNSGGDFPFSENYLFIENEKFSAEGAAEIICKHFDLVRS